MENVTVLFWFQYLFTFASSVDLPAISNNKGAEEFCRAVRDRQTEWTPQIRQMYSQLCTSSNAEEPFVWQGPCDTKDPVVLESRLKNGGRYDCRLMATNITEMKEYFVNYVDDSYFTEAKPLQCKGDCPRRVKEIQSLFRRHGNLGRGKILFVPPMAPEHMDFDEYHRKTQDGRHTAWQSTPGQKNPPILVRISRAVRPAVDPKIFGVAHRIKCTERNGLSDQGDPERFRTLCRSCWMIRTLPPEYFPKFVNENVCDGTQCLSNKNDTYGACRQQTMELDVLKNLGSEGCPKWQEEKLTVRTGCACTVMTYSELQKTPADYFFKVFDRTPWDTTA